MLTAEGKSLWVTNLVDPISKLNEIEFLIGLIKNPEFVIQSGPRKGCSDNVKISVKLNDIFHQGENIRTPGAVSAQLGRLKRKGEIS